MKYQYQMLEGEGGHRFWGLLSEIAISKEILIYAESINRDHMHMQIDISH